MDFVKNKLTITGGMEDLLIFIAENYERVYPCENKDISDYILFFDRINETPNIFLKDKNQTYEWRCKNWGTPFPAQFTQTNILTVLYRHDYDYSEYFLSNLNNKFDAYIFYRFLNKLDQYSSNINPDSNELTCEFNTVLSPPVKMIEFWIRKYYYTTLKFRLDYFDPIVGFVGNIQYDYNEKVYTQEHFSKQKDEKEYKEYLNMIGVEGYEE